MSLLDVINRNQRRRYRWGPDQSVHTIAQFLLITAINLDRQNNGAIKPLLEKAKSINRYFNIQALDVSRIKDMSDLDAIFGDVVEMIKILARENAISNEILESALHAYKIENTIINEASKVAEAPRYKFQTINIDQHPDKEAREDLLEAREKLAQLQSEERDAEEASEEARTLQERIDNLEEKLTTVQLDRKSFLDIMDTQLDLTRLRLELVENRNNPRKLRQIKRQINKAAKTIPQVEARLLQLERRNVQLEKAKKKKESKAQEYRKEVIQKRGNKAQIEKVEKEAERILQAKREKDLNLIETPEIKAVSNEEVPVSQAGREELELDADVISIAFTDENGNIDPKKFKDPIRRKAAEKALGRLSQEKAIARDIVHSVRDQLKKTYGDFELRHRMAEEVANVIAPEVARYAQIGFASVADASNAAEWYLKTRNKDSDLRKNMIVKLARTIMKRTPIPINENGQPDYEAHQELQKAAVRKAEGLLPSVLAGLEKINTIPTKDVKLSLETRTHRTALGGRVKEPVIMARETAKIPDGYKVLQGTTDVAFARSEYNKAQMFNTAWKLRKGLKDASRAIDTMMNVQVDPVTGEKSIDANVQRAHQKMQAAFINGVTSFEREFRKDPLKTALRAPIDLTYNALPDFLKSPTGKALALSAVSSFAGLGPAALAGSYSRLKSAQEEFQKKYNIVLKPGKFIKNYTEGQTKQFVNRLILGSARGDGRIGRLGLGIRLLPQAWNAGVEGLGHALLKGYGQSLTRLRLANPKAKNSFQGKFWRRFQKRLGSRFTDTRKKRNPISLIFGIGTAALTSGILAAMEKSPIPIFRTIARTIDENPFLNAFERGGGWADKDWVLSKKLEAYTGRTGLSHLPADDLKKLLSIDPNLPIHEQIRQMQEIASQLPDATDIFHPLDMEAIGDDPAVLKKMLENFAKQNPDLLQDIQELRRIENQSKLMHRLIGTPLELAGSIWNGGKILVGGGVRLALVTGGTFLATGSGSLAITAGATYGVPWFARQIMTNPFFGGEFKIHYEAGQIAKAEFFHGSLSKLNIKGLDDFLEMVNTPVFDLKNLDAWTDLAAGSRNLIKFIKFFPLDGIAFGGLIGAIPGIPLPLAMGIGGLGDAGIRVLKELSESTLAAQIFAPTSWLSRITAGVGVFFNIGELSYHLQYGGGFSGLFDVFTKGFSIPRLFKFLSLPGAYAGGVALALSLGATGGVAAIVAGVGTVAVIGIDALIRAAGGQGLWQVIFQPMVDSLWKFVKNRGWGVATSAFSIIFGWFNLLVSIFKGDIQGIAFSVVLMGSSILFLTVGTTSSSLPGASYTPTGQGGPTDPLPIIETENKYIKDLNKTVSVKDEYTFEYEYTYSVANLSDTFIIKETDDFDPIKEGVNIDQINGDFNSEQSSIDNPQDISLINQTEISKDGQTVTRNFTMKFDKPLSEAIGTEKGDKLCNELTINITNDEIQGEDATITTKPCFNHKGEFAAEFSVPPVEQDPRVRLTSCFANRGSEGFHAALDIGTSGSYPPVYAVGSGNVRVASTAEGSNGGYGYLVIIDHDNSEYSTYYAHLSFVSVSAGEHVNAGDKIGNVGNTGNSRGNHLHFEIRKGYTNYNPCYLMPHICNGVIYPFDQPNLASQDLTKCEVNSYSQPRTYP